jgi:hypothetical protein
VTVKYCALVKPTIMIRKTPHVPPMRGRPGGYRKDILGAASKSPRAIDRKERRTYGLETVSQRWPAQQQLVCQGAESRPPSVRWGSTWGGAWGMRGTLSSPLESLNPLHPPHSLLALHPQHRRSTRRSKAAPILWSPPNEALAAARCMSDAAPLAFPGRLLWLPRRCGSTSSTIRAGRARSTWGEPPRNKAVAHISSLASVFQRQKGP